MRRIADEGFVWVCAMLAIGFLAAAPAAALEPTGPIEIFAKVVAIEGGVDRAFASVEVEILQGAALEGLTFRLLDRRREPIEGVVFEGVGRGRSVRIPISGKGVHEMILEAVSGTARDEFAIRVPLGVPGFAPEDDGEIASFPLEVRP